MKEYSKGYTPVNIKANTEWALRNFKDWCTWRQNESPTDPVPSNLLSSNDADELNKWLSVYVMETRKKNGDRSPFSSLNLLLCGLRRHMKEINPMSPNFLDEKHPKFAGTRDVRGKKLHQDGIGASVKHTPIITHEEEASLWSQGVMGTKIPKSLFNAVFFMNGKILCLRGGREHKDLKLAQLTFGQDSRGEFVVYTENGSKNRSGSYKNPADNKIVKQYAVP